jgi:hypothetical protein
MVSFFALLCQQCCVIMCLKFICCTAGSNQLSAEGILSPLATISRPLHQLCATRPRTHSSMCLRPLVLNQVVVCRPMVALLIGGLEGFSTGHLLGHLLGLLGTDSFWVIEPAGWLFNIVFLGYVSRQVVISLHHCVGEGGRRSAHGILSAANGNLIKHSSTFFDFKHSSTFNCTTFYLFYA